MKNQATRSLYEYWRSKRGQRRAPRRGDINPSEIQHLLADSFILEVEPGQSTVYRLVGGRLNALFGQELTRQPFPYLWAPMCRDTVESALNIVLGDALCTVIGWQGRTNDGRRITGETLLTPVLLHDDAVERILGIASTHTAPLWLGHVPVVELDVTALRIIDPQRPERRAFARPTIDVGPATRATEQPIASRPTLPHNVVHMHPARQVGHLAVFEGGRQDK